MNDMLLLVSIQHEQQIYGLCVIIMHVVTVYVCNLNITNAYFHTKNGEIQVQAKSYKSFDHLIVQKLTSYTLPHSTMRKVTRHHCCSIVSEAEHGAFYSIGNLLCCQKLQKNCFAALNCRVKLETQRYTVTEQDVCLDICS